MPTRAMLAQHLHLLACPVCHAPLTLAEPQIRCTACHRHYPIVDNLPVLIPSRATLPTEEQSKA